MVAEPAAVVPAASRRTLTYGVTFALFVGLLVAYLFLAAQQVPVPFGALLHSAPFVLIGCLALFGLWLACAAQPFSLLVAHWTFILFFFSIAPAFQFLWGKFPPQSDLGKFADYHFHAAAVVIVWELVVLFTYRTPPESTEQRGNLWKSITPKIGNLFVLSALSVGAIIVVLGVPALISRNDRFAGFETISPALVMLSTICRAVPFTCALLAMLNWSKLSLAGKALAVGMVLLAMAANFPTGVARFWTGGIAVGLLCIWATGRFRSALWLPIMFLVSFLVMMPVLGSFRRMSASDVGSIQVTAPDLTEVPLRGDFDNYIMLVNSAYYVDNHEPTYGVTLVGNLLFFVPKTMWPDKPGNTRDLFIEGSKLEKINGNVANSLIAEAIMNFGWLGVLIYAFLFARLCRWLDRLYWGVSDPKSNFKASLVVFYPFLIGFFVYLLRGSFVPALASSVAFYAGIWVTVALATRNRSFKAVTRQAAAARQTA